MCTFDRWVTVVESLTTHNHLAKVFVVVADQICVVKDRTLFELMSISWDNTSDDGTDNAWFVDFAWLFLDYIYCCIVCACD